MRLRLPKRTFRVSSPVELREAARKAKRWARWGIAVEIRVAPRRGGYRMGTEPIPLWGRTTIKSYDPDVVKIIREEES